MATANRDGDQILVDVEYRDRDIIRSVPGAKWVRDRTWRLPLTWAAAWQLRGVFGDRLTIGDSLQEWANDEWVCRVEPALNAREQAMNPNALASPTCTKQLQKLNLA